MAAAVVYEKLGDPASTVAVYVESEQWEMVRSVFVWTNYRVCTYVIG